MNKVQKISALEPFKLICSFSNGEERILDLALVLKDKYGKKILKDELLFKKAKIGIFGEIYWDHVGAIIDLQGEEQPCEYDISPEFAYIHSQPKIS